MKTKFVMVLRLLFIILFFAPYIQLKAQKPTSKKVWVIINDAYNMNNVASSEGRQTATLLGHFNTNVTIVAESEFDVKKIAANDLIFYYGSQIEAKTSTKFLQYALKSSNKIIWLNHGLETSTLSEDFATKFGFKITDYQEFSAFDKVKLGRATFSKGNPEINLVQIVDKSKAKVLATVYSSKSKKENPYIVQSGNFYYFADSPLKNATENDRYLLFCDILHDFVGEAHQKSHKAIIRIEDVSALSDPNKLRDIADILSERNIPFLVGVVPIYVDPTENIRIKLSEKPEIVDALKYMVANGGTIVMHGVTHQYKGVSTSDFEFWDSETMKPIEGENAEEITAKLNMGIDEFVNNGLYPLLWETPHYTGSLLCYKTVANFFSSAIEQRLSIDNFDYGQYFPYIIEKDLFGQKVYPEDLGYIPLSPSKDSAEVYTNKILANAKSMFLVRAGFASLFFHPFIDLEILKNLADGIKDIGYDFYDIRQQKNWVKSKDKIILSGTQDYTMNISNSYLYEAYFDYEGKLIKKSYSSERYNGLVKKHIDLVQGQFYFAEPVEFQYKETSFKDEVSAYVSKTYRNLFYDKTSWQGMRPVILWNHFSRGENYKDQSSFVSIFKSLNVLVDTLYINEDLDLANYNLLIVPFAATDSLNEVEIQKIKQYITKGGNIVLDRKSKLAEALGITFVNAAINVGGIHDNFYPQEHISWQYKELTTKFEFDNKDEIFCEDPVSGLAMVIGRKLGKGGIFYINSLLDPYSKLGFSRYPYVIEHIMDFFKLKPFVRRDNLEMYFDPGLRPNISVESLVKLWVKEGIRIVHVAGWHKYPKYTYDYKRLISDAHGNGILVFAWLEPPQVNLRFWDEHPQWREKNYLDKEVQPEWRSPMALTDEVCLSAIIVEYMTMLEQFDFDGVNLAELYFASNKGFSDPEKFTPMHISARNEFAKINKFDPKLVFDPKSIYYWKTNKSAKEAVIHYRVDKTSEIQERFLKAFYQLASKRPGFQVMVTTMDAYGSPELKEELGIDMEKILELQKKYHFLLQIQDPASQWSESPKRYLEIGKFYNQKIQDTTKLLLDLNILKIRNAKDINVTQFPTLTQTGIESYQLIHFSALGASRNTIYSEGSVNPQDLSMFAYANAAHVNYTYTDDGFDVESPTSFSLELPPSVKALLIDNNPVIGNRENLFFIPAGKHIIKYANENMLGFSSALIQPQILSFTGNILASLNGMKSVKFTYQSQGRGIVTLNRKPETAIIDGVNYKFEVMKGNECFSIFLPEGKHQIEIFTGTSLTYGVDVTSLWSSSAIVVFGTIAVILMMIMYLIVRIVRSASKK